MKYNNNVNKLENFYLQLIEEKQLELIWHPERREECGIQFATEFSSIIIYSYRGDTPICVFRELNMCRLFLSNLQFNDWSEEDWKPYALKAISYLRMLPLDVRKRELEYYHNAVANTYKAIGDERRANSHYKQALIYHTEEEIDVTDIKSLLHSLESPKSKLDLCLYILSFITSQGIWGMDDYFTYWEREHYQLIESILKIDLTSYVVDQSEKPLVDLLTTFLKGYYYKRTRRFKLSEKHFLKALDIQTILANQVEETAISPLTIYLPLVHVYLEMGNDQKAQIYMKKAEETVCWDAKILEPLIKKAYHGSPLSEEQWDNIDNHYINLFHNLCKENRSVKPSIKEAIDVFFDSTEIYDYQEEENEEEGENNEEENQNNQEYYFDDWYELAENGDVNAQLVIGHCYYTGTMVTQNYRLAREWFYLGALQGNPIAQINLGYMYEKGYGTEVDIKEAEKWYQKSKNKKVGKQEHIEFCIKE